MVSQTVFIHGSSVNARRRETGGPEEASASFNPAEKRLYAYSEKNRNIPLGGSEKNAITQLRSVTRLDPMTYMLFGAYDLVVTQRGLKCDSWLPVVGNLHALDDIQRLKTLLDGCMLRVFEGVGKSLTRGRDERWVKARDSVVVGHGRSSRIQPESEPGAGVGTDGGDEGENESDEEGELGLEALVPKRMVEPMSLEEIKELEMLTTDVVRILDAYAAEREGGSVVPSRPTSPGLGGGSGQGMYRPPGASARRW